MISAVILAGGLGTRLRSTVPDVPKPMASVAGRPFLEYQLDYWIGKGIERFILSVGYRHEVIIEHFGDRYNGVELLYVVEQVPLGTGGGLLLAVKEVGLTSPFLLLNGDTYFEADWAYLSNFAESNNADWCFSLFRSNEDGRYMGMDISPEGEILSMKASAMGLGCLSNGGAYWVRPQVLEEAGFRVGTPVSLEDDIFPAMKLAGRRMFGIEFCGTFIDIGVPDDYFRAESLLGFSGS